MCYRDLYEQFRLHCTDRVLSIMTTLQFSILHNDECNTQHHITQHFTAPYYSESNTIQNIALHYILLHYTTHHASKQFITPDSPCRVARGSDVEDRRSQTFKTGFLSSPLDVTKCRPTGINMSNFSGFQRFVKGSVVIS